ncbi:uncharacterized protein LOC132053329 [Lycium ferocissimum]|uniref:uncharacterized protein LOC132053329 n=1 Tax=Lycium ferocissimum TaxID=112874 RepID=UPI0028153654|nr:uncharacterized protein LOC132053329 [Lycium ferocissimum]XP_059301288.1 uncharacterized protein LOC132053329 [Lycium ferocissimum]
MEDKQLKFNQPLLSVRRISSAVISQRDEKKKTDNYFPAMTCPPHYKSELKSGLVGKPGTVPFRWEHSPGRPKDERGPKTHLTEKPKLPPGWKLRDNHDFDQTGKIQNTMPSFTSSDENVKKIESFDSSKEMMHDKEKIESEDGDETYLDALDTLSRTESSYLNCSVSGLSEFDEPDSNPRTKDFMMGRFLPASKAMASDKTSETPYYVRKKQPPVEDHQRQMMKVINGDRRPQLRYGPSFTLYHSQAHEEEEESDDDGYNNENLSTKICGLLPHFCLKSSFRHLNPIPAMGVRTRIPVSPVSRTRTGSSSTASCSGTENEQSTSDISEQRSVVGSVTTQLHEDKNDVKGRADSTYANDIYKNNTIISTNPEVKCLGLEERPSQRFHEVDVLTPVVEKTLYIDTVHKMDSSAKIVPDSEGREKTRKPIQRREGLENSCKVHPEFFPVPPPLPKSPSDSWLCRTLSTKNAPSRAYIGTVLNPTNQPSKPLPSDPKWETIVKMTKKQ